MQGPYDLVPAGTLPSLLLVLLGVVLLLVELHRPGRVLPGAAGLLAGSLGARGLWMAGVTQVGVALAGFGAGLLLLHSLLRVRALWVGVVGAVLFATGLVLLPARGGWLVRSVAGVGGALLGGAAAWLGAVAVLARLNKQIHQRASAEADARGEAERWEPRGG